MPTKKLIEVALPLDVINTASAREKSIRHGHPSTLHLWWSRKPLAVCRAVLFASLVDDPSSHPELFPDEISQQQERVRLFEIIERLVQWENSHNPVVLAEAHAEIQRSTNGQPPPVYDPFAGGGSIPLEAQRLGLEAHASDLNPVAVLINKALIEIPPRFAESNVIPLATQGSGERRPPTPGSALARDIQHYGEWMRTEAARRIGHYYPQITLPDTHGGGPATVIAWLWTRTVRCPNPACGVQMPLASSFVLSSKPGKEAWVEPVVTEQRISFKVHQGQGEVPESPKIGRGAKFRCLACGHNAEERNIRKEFQTKQNCQQLMAIVAEGPKGRVYLDPDEAHEKKAYEAVPPWKPEEEMNQSTPNLVSGRGYGITHWHEIFTPRQLLALTTFSDLIGEVHAMVRRDYQQAQTAPDDERPLAAGGRGATAYADAIATYLAFAVDKCADYNSSICSWHSGRDTIGHTFTRQALPMLWDFAEANPFSASTGNFTGALRWIMGVCEKLPASTKISDNFIHTAESGIAVCESRPERKPDSANQRDATTALNGATKPIVSIDPPYYDNIGYADLADFFYVWLRRSLGTIYPDLFSTLLVPKDQELVATPYRFGGDKRQAETFFETGLHSAFELIHKKHHDDYPLTIYYAYKQSEGKQKSNGKALVASDSARMSAFIASTGWENILSSLLNASFMISGTWPLRTEQTSGVKTSINALASSILLVCRPRPVEAPAASRRELLTALRCELPAALRLLQDGNIAPVDLAQAAIGPGMAIFSRYRQVLESDGTPMPVRTALQLINQILDEVLTEQEGAYDSDTRWALAWFDQFGMHDGQYGVAETLSKAKNTSVAGMVAAGIIEARAGKVRLLRRDELPTDWCPTTDTRSTIWEATQQLVHALDQRGEHGAAALLGPLNGESEAVRDLAYRLYTTCERKKWAQEALAYNSLVIAWPSIARLAHTPSETVET
ncbi:MAG: DUF1156 domain-containing protein [Chloroflexi bacterium AL-W]|nr:DUF1156 domain-containing protein [Chloroflexi bacterium AL-N1]NOK68257.1 DUF1156 domain-containing protein [Chloroflexi bacterium AL-N10]NOK73903.1 DUF1156 domain-containing protein [Chloroflexi bacterium AL-N5]NOK82871.1 DUF1156 domain-containing protein [Chloroflexi bacterium AL-W]NOK90393.1 DUF1156 domain-containing protein [Chloroflexi bacterium AL-N15]